MKAHEKTHSLVRVGFFVLEQVALTNVTWTALAITVITAFAVITTVAVASTVVTFTRRRTYATWATGTIVITAGQAEAHQGYATCCDSKKTFHTSSMCKD